jgi:hypothetical protein
VLESGELDCGVRWTVSGESDYEDVSNSGYGMLMELEVDVDTCGLAGGGVQYLAVYEVQGSQWHAFNLYYYDESIDDWPVFAAETPGELTWDPDGASGAGWIEYRSVPFFLVDDEAPSP